MSQFPRIVSALSLYIAFSWLCDCKIIEAEISLLRMVAISLSNCGICPMLANSSQISEKKDDHGYCLGLGSEGLGCAWVFIPGNIEKVCRAMGAEEVYIVPLSVNEAVFHDVRKITDMENLWRSFWDTVASYIPAEEFLTVHIYRYSMKTGKLTTIMPDEGVIKSYQQGKDSKWRKEYLDMPE